MIIRKPFTPNKDFDLDVILTLLHSHYRDNYVSAIENNYINVPNYSSDDHLKITTFLGELQTEHQIDILKCLTKEDEHMQIDKFNFYYFSEFKKMNKTINDLVEKLLNNNNLKY